ncbi:cardiolipin synthase [Secundilactobacillus paracollinoides]|uniref:cardiolipin synthase n=1 Tax=Secundilactobacillus paracollinoides TaxID=240427 RepID=UPI0006EF079A|nr:cardiolipin synthase [Secundilactobacillus paracollinoides]ANZ64049.1 cardiolipin synthase [Secundilactobacillus paracollinoides]KRL76884.1 phosphatidylserine phosphatidylglycerophosphate cardiolipin synthase-like protein [Secundilactobacillus paracollinoides DSM 15502 = JCM 11969]
MTISWSMILGVIYAINLMTALFTVFRQRRDIAAMWAWLLVLLLLPVIGFIFYAFFGRQLPKNKLFKVDNTVQTRLDTILSEQRELLLEPDTSQHPVSRDIAGTMQLFMRANRAFLTRRNRVKLFTDGNSLFDAIIRDINAAQRNVNVEFYTFYNDEIGSAVLSALVARAKAGVTVRVIYDPWGSMGTYRRFFKPLIDAGGYVEPFLARSAILDFRLNFRNHRKIVVVDGEIGYVGGFNIGDQYLGCSKKFGHWRDTHIRIEGAAVFALQSRFVLDWNATSKKAKLADNYVDRDYFPVMAPKGLTSMQIVSSGPDSQLQQIKMGYIRLIQMAKKRLWIQSPYFIPDDGVIEALKIAIMSGVDVRIMVPSMPDHPFVYRATQHFCRDTAEIGAKIYYYGNGFLHAKTMLVDDEVASVGSANMDYRSFKLNFEVNAFLYDKEINTQLAALFEQDMAESTLITPEMFADQSLYLRFKQSVSRLLAPIL